MEGEEGEKNTQPLILGSPFCRLENEMHLKGYIDWHIYCC